MSADKPAHEQFFDVACRMQKIERLANEIRRAAELLSEFIEASSDQRSDFRRATGLSARQKLVWINPNVNGAVNLHDMNEEHRPVLSVKLYVPAIKGNRHNYFAIVTRIDMNNEHGTFHINSQVRMSDENGNDFGCICSSASMFSVMAKLADYIKDATS